MKKQILIFLISISSILTVNAQTWTGSSDVNGNLWRNGNIGIGTTNPLHKFVVSNASTEGFEVYLGQPTGIVGLQSYNRATNTYSKMQFDASQFAFTQGKFGIGTTTAYQNFVVSNSGADGFEVYLGQPTGIVGLQSYNRATNTYSKMQFDASQFAFTNGNVGIGTTSPCYKLDVYGTIRTDEVVVNLTHGCDFVFKSNYKLMDLRKLEEFVKTNQHLPEIASEPEMIESGVNMKDLQMKLLQKMEEMTLYMIEQNKKLEQQNEKIMTLENEIKELKTK
ncbi:MAG: hypothetical protein EHM93_12355 [Bacteroidales bacterium]|nr:MAG: hypothetical protein EHM93_12355 [Bacteroidales bacterium]